MDAKGSCLRQAPYVESSVRTFAYRVLKYFRNEIDKSVYCLDQLHNSLSRLYTLQTKSTFCRVTKAIILYLHVFYAKIIVYYCYTSE